MLSIKLLLFNMRHNNKVNFCLENMDSMEYRFDNNN